jgi:hypothetical protein
MTHAGNAFADLVGAILARYFRQNDLPAPPEAEIAHFAAQLWALIGERGLPRPLGPAELGTPGKLPETEVALLLDRVLGGTSPAWRAALEGPASQLVKACFYPEFKTCRDSFREISPDGTCRRQELGRARGRVSGVHCVDCPHWVALTPEQHVRYVTKNWRPEGAADFAAHRGVFLPEDFRAFRRLLHALARAGI